MPAPTTTPVAAILPANQQQTLHWQTLADAELALLAISATRFRGLVLVVTPDSQSAQRLEAELRFFGGAELEILSLPDTETLPYDQLSAHPDIISQRLATLYRLPQLRRGLLIIPASALMQRLPPRGYLDAHALLLKRGDTLHLHPLRERLEAAGYHCVSQVAEHGEFALRGGILDLFPMGAAAAYRIELFDDTVESIRIFEPETQLSAGKIERIQLLPARECALDTSAISHFRQQWRRIFSGDPQRSVLYREVSAGHAPSGIEYYLPLFFESCATLFDYLPLATLVLQLPQVESALETFQAQIMERYEQRRYDLERPLLAPQELFLSSAEVAAALQRYLRIAVGVDAGGVSYPFAQLPDVALQPRHAQPAQALQQFLANFNGRVLLVAASPGRRELLREALQGYGIAAQLCGDWAEFMGNEQLRLAVTVAPLQQGLLVQTPPLAIISEAQLYGERVQTTQRRSPQRDMQSMVRDLTDLTVGAPLVHEQYGVGRYAGLQRLQVAGLDGEFVCIEYAQGERLYVPVADLQRLSRYSGADAEHAPLHKLGSGQWEKIKRKAAERITDAAAELLDVYARRATQTGHAFTLNTADYHAFASAFPFAETVDQQAAIAAVISDLCAAKPMDRVICGDVGFGKTEVAMRAAFVVALAQYQVAVLAPTTLLAQQHYQNFLDRFADWPLRIEVLSRFRSAKQQAATLQALCAGKVDILIGTHRLLQDNVKFRNLGLVIVDEEHRFGVRHKERLKSLRAAVDMLTLTATPIPRTLNMALAGLRDLSIIATPPAGRLAVKTFVGEWNEALLLEACQRELKRGGQIYFLHNEVDSIQRIAAQVGALVPQAQIAIAHGQMRERELEQVMLDFYHRRCNLLICTTIIESGIDVPNANTIIIHRADKLGLAQLHQLRGRVGRSHHRAYAYLIVPPKNVMTSDAVKRIEAITALEDLGAGFMLANHDLEIRGAGELLGEAQSGQIHELGFTLYMDWLERAVQALKSGEMPHLEPARTLEIDLQSPALIPDDYLPDVALRLMLYKRIASASDDATLRQLQVEMIDRFGLLPPQVKTLFRIAALKLRATALGVQKIEVGAQSGRLLFDAKPRIDGAKLVALIQQQSHIYKLDGRDKLRFMQDMPDVEARALAVETLLHKISL